MDVSLQILQCMLQSKKTATIIPMLSHIRHVISKLTPAPKYKGTFGESVLFSDLLKTKTGLSLWINDVFIATWRKQGGEADLVFITESEVCAQCKTLSGLNFSLTLSVTLLGTLICKINTAIDNKDTEFFNTFFDSLILANEAIYPLHKKHPSVRNSYLLALGLIQQLKAHQKHFFDGILNLKEQAFETSKVETFYSFACAVAQSNAARYLVPEYVLNFTASESLCFSFTAIIDFDWQFTATSRDLVETYVTVGRKRKKQITPYDKNASNSINRLLEVCCVKQSDSSQYFKYVTTYSDFVSPSDALDAVAEAVFTQIKGSFEP